MHYDATWDGLFYPERQPPLPVQEHAWTLDARCAEFSRLVFIPFEADPAPLTAALAAHGFGQLGCFFDPEHDTAAFAAIDGAGTAVVCFRGTCKDSRHNVASDLKAWPARWHGGGWVHAGFGQAYCNRVQGEIASWLEANPHDQLVCTGISLGAALATLLAADHPGAALVTFGSPRVGTRGFGALLSGREVHRYVDCADTVPSLPPPLGYRHVGAMRYIDRSGRVQADLPGLLTRIADQLSAHLWFVRRHLLRRGKTLARTLSDHAPINYVTALLGIRDS
jgi:pimeloyl-ACP methyl ester carboxylesterase